MIGAAPPVLAAMPGDGRHRGMLGARTAGHGEVRVGVVKTAAGGMAAGGRTEEGEWSGRRRGVACSPL